MASHYHRCYNAIQMNGTRSHIGRIKASAVLIAVICLQFCATTCALGNCTPSTSKRFDRVVTQKTEHCHQHSDQSKSSKEPKKQDPQGCHSANEVIAALPDTTNLSGGNTNLDRIDFATLPANIIYSIRTDSKQVTRSSPFESPPKRAVITSLRI